MNHGKVQHWLNGKKVVEYELWTPEWERLKTDGKWKDFPDYGVARRGQIGLAGPRQQGLLPQHQDPTDCSNPRHACPKESSR